MKRRSTPVNYTEATSVSQHIKIRRPSRRTARRPRSRLPLGAMTSTSAPLSPRPAEQLRADARQNHARLIAAATAAFAERGADAALEAIARRAGGGMGTPYR